MARRNYQNDKAWLPGDIDKRRIFLKFSPEAERDLMGLVESLNGLQSIEHIDFNGNHLSAFANDIKVFRKEVEDGYGFVVIQPSFRLSISEHRAIAWAITNYLGTPLVQNRDGNRLIHVYDRDRTKRIEDGARYHQTRQGGSIHTDNVNIPDHWEYLVFSCVAPAMCGGESILISGLTVYNDLAQRVPQALEILTQPFWWEYRGISEKLYEAPVITFNGHDEPLFRYLRPYLASAHNKAKQPLTAEQFWALDVLDSVLESSHLQFRYALKAGEILITNDSQILHGRTSFADYFETATIENYNQNGKVKLRRSMDRAWVQRS